MVGRIALPSATPTNTVENYITVSLSADNRGGFLRSAYGLRRCASVEMTLNPARGLRTEPSDRRCGNALIDYYFSPLRAGINGAYSLICDKTSPSGATISEGITSVTISPSCVVIFRSPPSSIALFIHSLILEKPFSISSLPKLFIHTHYTSFCDVCQVIK